MTKLDQPGSWVRLDVIRDARGLRVDAKTGPDFDFEFAPEVAGRVENVELFGEPVTLPERTIATVALCAHLIASEPVPVLPVFVAPRRDLRHLPWEHALGEALTERTSSPNLELIRLARPKGPPAPEAELPFRLLAAGKLAVDAMDRLGKQGWLDDPNVRTHGLAITTTKEARIERELRDLRPTVVVADARFLPEIIRWGAGRPRSQHRGLRLVIAIADGVGLASKRDRAPDGTSIVTVDRTRATETIADLVLGLVHDQPLHAVVNGVRLRGASVQMRATPASVHSLRLEPIARKIIDEQARLREHLGRVFGLRRERVDEVVGSNVRLDFLNETGGFSDAARARGKMLLGRSVALAKSLATGSGVEAPGSVESVKDRRRSVDLQLEPVLDHGRQWIPRNSTLRRGARYRVCMTIGLPLDGSLFDEPPPSIDSVLPPLPDQQERELEVAIYGFGFEVLGQVVQKLRLPARGPAGPLRFDVRARDLATCRLRLIVYYQNEAVQSYLIVAPVTSDELAAFENTLHAKLEFSRSPELANLGKLRPRVACIAVNASPSDPATHTFMIKGKGADASAVNLPSAALDTPMKLLRATLFGATFSGANPRFPMTGDVNSVDFRTVFRQLADQGRALYNMLAQRARDRDKLKVIRDTSGQTIQIVRLDLGYSFPWGLLYDFALPSLPAAGAASAVCLDPNCSHGITNPGYCVRGFWGIRHVVEELLGEADRDDTDPVIPPGPGRGVTISLGLDDAFGKAIETAATAFAGATSLASAASAHDLIDALWDDKRRPAHLIVYSHLDTSNGRALVFAHDQLTPSALSDEWQKTFQEWRAPRPVVFLMACSSVAIDDSLLGGFAEILHSAGARAILGTEAPAFAALVTECAGKIGADWWSGQVTLGEALRRYRIDLLRRGNPLGFVFTALGNSDLRLVKGAGG